MCQAVYVHCLLGTTTYVVATVVAVADIHLVKSFSLACPLQSACSRRVRLSQLLLVLQDTVPAENSVISMLMKANNKATGTPFNHM